jgi:hypothetical protein
VWLSLERNNAMYDRQDMIDMILILFSDLTLKEVQNKVDMVLDQWETEEADDYDRDADMVISN